jgi:serine/threonine protein kinase
VTIPNSGPDRLAVAFADRSRIERFVQEIKTTAALSHPHILPLFDSGEAAGFLYTARVSR